MSSVLLERFLFVFFVDALLVPFLSCCGSGFFADDDGNSTSCCPRNNSFLTSLLRASGVVS